MAKTNEFDLSGFEKQSDGTYKKRKTVAQPRDIVSPDRKSYKHIGKASHEQVQSEIAIQKNIPIFDGDNNMLIFEWQGKDLSLNKWYAGKHWSERNRIANEWHAFYKKFLCFPYPTFNQYRILLQYNSKLDPSNTIPMIKLLEDALQEVGIIKDDTMKYCKGLKIIPDPTMKKKHYKLTVINIP